MKIFISGSRKITSLSSYTETVLKKIIERDIDEILIGDCDGIDYLVQKFFKKNGYTKVLVYVSGDGHARRNAGFNEKHIPVDPNIPFASREFYAVKDIAMSNDCNVGIAIWDGKSRGTFQNIERLHKLNKCVQTILNKN